MEMWLLIYVFCLGFFLGGMVINILSVREER